MKIKTAKELKEMVVSYQINLIEGKIFNAINVGENSVSVKRKDFVKIMWDEYFPKEYIRNSDPSKSENIIISWN